METAVQAGGDVWLLWHAGVASVTVKGDPAMAAADVAQAAFGSAVQSHSQWGQQEGGDAFLTAYLLSPVSSDWNAAPCTRKHFSF